MDAPGVLHHVIILGIERKVLFHNLGVNHAKDVTCLRNRLCGLRECASAQFLDLLELAENCTFLDRKLIIAFKVVADGHELALKPVFELQPFDALKFFGVMRYQNAVAGERCTGNQNIIGSY